MEQLIERIAKAPLGAKVGVVAAVVVVLTALNFFVVAIPAFGAPIDDIEKKIKRTDQDQRRLDNDLIEKTAIANNLNQFRREKELLEQKLSEALAELPEEKRIDELLQLFQERARKSGLEITTIEPQATVAEGFYARIPIAMTVTGNFHEIATFFDSLGRLRRIVNVSNIVMDNPKDVSGKVVVNAKFLVTTFMFVEQKKLNDDLIDKTSIANNLNQFRREKELLEQRLQEALAELPEDKKIDEVLQLFQDRASKAGVEILTIEPKPQVAEGFYARIPIPMAVQGNYHEIATFLDAIGRLRRIVNVNNLVFEQPRDQNGRLVLTANFLATTFMFVDTAPKPAAGAAKP